MEASKLRKHLNDWCNLLSAPPHTGKGLFGMDCAYVHLQMLSTECSQTANIHDYHCIGVRLKLVRFFFLFFDVMTKHTKQLIVTSCQR